MKNADDLAMNANYIDPSPFLNGIVFTRGDADGFYWPLRITAAQLECYRGIPRCCYPYAPAGVRFEFTTDAPSVSFDYRTRTFWTWWKDADPTFDFYVDGHLRTIAKVEASEGDGFRTAAFGCPADGRRHLVTIWFPCNVELLVRVRGGAFGDAAPVHGRARRFLIYGDSISQGLMGNTASQNYACILARFFDADLLNESLGGDAYDVTALDAGLGYDPTDVIVALGTNDVCFFKDHDMITAAMKPYLAKIAEMYPDADVTVISPPWMTTWDTTGAEAYREMQAFTVEIRAEAARHGFRFLTGDELIPHDARFFSDELHPNDLGFAHYALNLIRQL